MKAMEALPQKSRLEFHRIIEQKVQEVNYGTVTVNVILKDGEPLLPSLNIVKAKRWKFKTEDK
jgi:hypothetical protein